MIPSAEQQADLDKRAERYARARGVSLERENAGEAIPTGGRRGTTHLEGLKIRHDGFQTAGMVAVFRSHLEALSDGRALRIEADRREREKLTFWIDLLTSHFEQGETLAAIALRYGHRSHTWALDQIAELTAAGWRYLRAQGALAALCAWERCKRGGEGRRATLPASRVLDTRAKFCCDACASAHRMQRKRDRSVMSTVTLTSRQ